MFCLMPEAKATIVSAGNCAGDRAPAWQIARSNRLSDNAIGKGFWLFEDDLISLSCVHSP